MPSLKPLVATRSRVTMSLALIAVSTIIFLLTWRDFCLWRAGAKLRTREHDAAAVWVDRSEWVPGNADSQALLLRIRIARRRHQFREVEDLLQQAAKRGVSKTALKRERLLAMAQTGQFAAMQSQWSDLLSDPREDGPEIAKAYYTWTMLNHHLELANKTLDLWQKDYPRDPEPFALRGRFHESIFNWKEAEKDYRRALGLAPGNDDYRLSLATVLLERLNTKGAIPLFEEYLRRHPDDLTAVRGLAQCAATDGDIAKAVTLLRTAYEKSPTDFAVQKAYGEILLSSGDAAAAVEVLEKAYQSVPEHANLAYSLARGLKACGRASEAEPLFQFVSESRPQLDRLQDLEKELRVQPNNLELRMQIAAISAKYVARRDAIRWYQNILQISPEYPPAHKALADLYRSMGDEQQAAYHDKIMSRKGTRLDTKPDRSSAPSIPPGNDADSRQSLEADAALRR